MKHLRVGLLAGMVGVVVVLLIWGFLVLSERMLWYCVHVLHWNGELTSMLFGAFYLCTFIGTILSFARTTE